MSAFTADVAATPRYERAARYDSLIKASRAATPPGVTEQRKAPRYSITELDDVDMEALRDRIASSRLEGRGPVQQALDLVDLPRNVIASTVFPTIRRRKEAMGDVGTAGLGRVYVSDVLEEMGVKSRVIRGVVGFVGDVLMDPLTYLGPAGWGAKGVALSGKVATVGRTGRRAINVSVRDTARGLAPSDPTVAKYLAAQGIVPGSADYATAARKAIRGDGRTPFNAFLGGLGADVERKGGILADAAEAGVLAQGARGEAAREFLGRYGRDVAPGLRIGRKPGGGLGVQVAKQGDTGIQAGSTVAHIPFTEIGIHVPAFTRSAQYAGIAGQVARAIPGELPPDLSAGMAEVERLSGMYTRHGDVAREAAEWDDRVRTDPTLAIYPTASLTRARLLDESAQLESEIKAGRKALDKSLSALSASPAKNIGEVVALHRLRDTLLDLDRHWRATTAETLAADGAVRTAGKELGGIVERRAAALVEEARAAHPPPMARAEMVAELEEFPAVAVANQRVLESGADDEILALLNETRASFTDKPPASTLPFDEPAAASAARAQAENELRATRGESAADFFDNLTPEQIEIRAKTADLFAERMGASKQLADTTGRVLQATAKSRDLDLSRAATYALGYTPDEIGHGPFMPLGDAVAGIMGRNLADPVGFLETARRADSGWRRIFGNPRNIVHEIQRAIVREKSASSPETARRMVAFDGEMRAAMKSHPNLSRADADNGVRLLMMAKLDPNQRIFWPDDPAWAALKSATASGVLADPAVRATLEGIAGRNTDMLQDFLGAEQRAGMLLGGGREGYVPHVLALGVGPVVREAMKNFRKQLAAAGMPEEQIGGAIEGFLKPRSTEMYKFDMPVKQADGSTTTAPAQFAEFERWVLGFRGKNLETMRRADPTLAKYIEDTTAKIDAYEKLPETLRPPPRPMSIDWINQEKDAFSILKGGRDLKFFEDSPARFMAERAASHRVAHLQAYFNELTDRYAVPVNEMKLATTTGDRFTLDNGVSGRIDRQTIGSSVLRTVVIGNQKFRRIDAAAMSQFNPLAGVTGPKAFDAYYPEEVADAIDNIGRLFKDQGDVEHLLQMADKLTAMWKGVTLLHPSWTVVNMIGGMIQLGSIGLAPWEYFKYAKSAGLLMLHLKRPERLAKLTFDTTAGPISGTELLKMLDDTGLLNSSISAEVMSQALAGGYYVTPNQHSLLKALAKGDRAGIKAAAAEMTASAEMRMRASAYTASMRGRGVNMLRKGAKLVIDEGYMNRLIRPWFAANGKSEDWLRVMGFLAMMDKGNDATSAARRVTEALFDFSDLTKFESDYARKMLPFYVWLKNSGFYGMRQLADNPKYVSIVPHLKRAMEEAINGQETVPDYVRPEWMREQLALQIGSDPSNRTAVMIGSMMPQEMMLRLTSGAASPALGMEGAWDLVSYLGQSVNPLVKAVGELAAGQEFFTGRSISLKPGEGDLDVDEYFLQQIRPLREFGIGQTRKGPLVNAAEQGPGALAARLAVGGRAQPFTDDRIRFNVIREMKKREEGIKSRIRLAEREGATEAALEGKVRLMLLYKAMEEKGIGDQVPKWAMGQRGQDVARAVGPG